MFRWLIDSAADGVTNMARDEAILTAVGRGEAPPTLRFYRWDPPTISLGYFQAFTEFERLPPPAGRLAVVRRQTGGGAILHDRELTYSLTVPNDHSFLAEAGPNRLYDRVHDAVRLLLQRSGIGVEKGPPDGGTCSHGGPFFCFERHSCHDLLIAGAKLMGSAQRRTPQAVLQHGSLVLERRFAQQACAALADYTDLRIEDHLGQLAAMIAGANIEKVDQLSPAEIACTEQLKTKYADPAWTGKR